MIAGSTLNESSNQDLKADDELTDNFRILTLDELPSDAKEIVSNASLTKTNDIKADAQQILAEQNEMLEMSKQFDLAHENTKHILREELEQRNKREIDEYLKTFRQHMLLKQEKAQNELEQIAKAASSALRDKLYEINKTLVAYSQSSEAEFERKLEDIQKQHEQDLKNIEEKAKENFERKRNSFEVRFAKFKDYCADEIVKTQNEATKNLLDFYLMKLKTVFTPSQAMTLSDVFVYSYKQGLISQLIVLPNDYRQWLENSYVLIFCQSKFNDYHNKTVPSPRAIFTILLLLAIALKNKDIFQAFDECFDEFCNSMGLLSNDDAIVSFKKEIYHLMFAQDDVRYTGFYWHYKAFELHLNNLNFQALNEMEDNQGYAGYYGYYVEQPAQSYNPGYQSHSQRNARNKQHNYRNNNNNNYQPSGRMKNM